MMSLNLRLWLFGIGVGLLLPFAALAQCGPQSAMAELVSVYGRVTIDQRPAILGARLCEGQILRAGPQSRAAVYIQGADTVLRIDELTELHLRPPRQGRWYLRLFKGIAYLFSRVRQTLDVETPFVNGGIEGTEFLIAARDDHAVVSVFEGTVVATNAQGWMSVRAGEAIEAYTGQVPQGRIAVSSQNAVAWALYYPPVVTAAEAEADPVLVQAAQLLAAGQVKAAEALIADRRDDGPTAALRTIIAVTQNRHEEALRRGHRAVASHPDSAAAALALSYAHQANFQIPEALAAIERLPKPAASAPLIQTRRAELLLSLGHREAALDAAQVGIAAAPELGRAHTMLGFAALAAIRTEVATRHFLRSIALDSQDPLPRIGLGLARIRGGALAQGRREIEIAVSLDPNNALLRSYLGKAYFEERRGPLDETQFDLAKALDPADPTPWFYDAIRKQSENRPIEALADFQTSIDKNANRAVYRSRFLLDEDRAARSAARGRIYTDLGFDRLGGIEASRALADDPGSHGAHRLLADTYAKRPGHDIARVSELFQAQLMQPLNINNLQPQLAEADLQILQGAGPSTLSQNEFNPVFMRNRFAAQVNAVGGTQETLGNDLLLSGIQDDVAYSVGQFHYQTEGFRENNDQRHDIASAFLQWAATPRLSLQAEVRQRESRQGDLNLRFDPTLGDPTYRRDFDRSSMRLGGRYALGNDAVLLASAGFADHDETVRQQSLTPALPPLFFTSQLSSESVQMDTQLQLRRSWGSVVAGFTTAHVDAKLHNILDFGPLADSFCALIACDTRVLDDEDNLSAYLYGYFKPVPDLRMTLGGAFERYESSHIDVQELYPRLGLEWSFADWGRLRLGYYRNVKRPMQLDQTLEPTQLAGFNQFFDDTNGARTERYGVGLDLELSPRVFTGFEVSKRSVRHPILQSQLGRETQFIDREEMLAHAYLYWIPTDRLALSAELEYDQYEDDPRDPFLVLHRFEGVDTSMVPVELRYFAPGGWFGRIGTTYVSQDVDPLAGLGVGREHDDFFVTDLALGYRLPRRSGLISLEVHNVLDETFFFQDDNIRLGRPAATPRFMPERTVLLKVSLALD